MGRFHYVAPGRVVTRFAQRSGQHLDEITDQCQPLKFDGRGASQPLAPEVFEILVG